MKFKYLTRFLLITLALVIGVPVSASKSPQGTEQDSTAHTSGGDHEYSNEAKISETSANKAGIETAVAGPGTIHETVTLYGKTALDHDNISHVRARYPGPAIEVFAEIGQRVEKGDRLATIESNESLQPYALRTPITGEVIEKEISRGEFSGERVLFTIANPDPLLAELQVFPGQRNQISPGNNVLLKAGGQVVSSTIKSVVPAAHEKPFAIARALIDNRKRQWAPGLMVQGQVMVNVLNSPLVVENRALQPLRGATVVFVKTGDRYRARPLRLGRSDGRVTEVLGGLQVGERYVTANSYLIKADIEKSAAEHD